MLVIISCKRGQTSRQIFIPLSGARRRRQCCQQG